MENQTHLILNVSSKHVFDFPQSSVLGPFLRLHRCSGERAPGVIIINPEHGAGIDGDTPMFYLPPLL